MKTVLSFVFIILSSGSAHAIAAIQAGLVVTTIVPTAPTLVTSDASGLFDGMKKEIIAAKEDAVAFLATEGHLRGVRLQRALEILRSQNPSLTSSDMDLAQEILTVE